MGRTVRIYGEAFGWLMASAEQQAENSIMRWWTALIWVSCEMNRVKLEASVFVKVGTRRGAEPVGASDPALPRFRRSGYCHAWIYTSD